MRPTRRSRPSILVTRVIADPALDLLRRRSGLDINRLDRNLSAAELARRIADKDGVIGMLSDSFDRRLIERAERLKVISLCASGHNNVDLEFAASRGIIVTNTPDALKNAVADLTWALILGTTRRVAEGDREVKLGGFRGWAPLHLLGHNVHEKTLGILGMGKIGREVAARASGFRMRVIYHNRHRVAQRIENELNARWVTFDRLLEESDILVLLLPLTQKTHHLIGSPELRRMKRTSYLVNIGRGPVVEEKALVQALRRGWISGAGLDVYEFEPTVGIDLRQLANVLLLPHIGSATVEARTRMSMEAARNALAVLNGRKPLSVVTPPRS